MFTGVNFEKAIDYYKKGKEVIVLDRNSLGKNGEAGYDTFPFSELGTNLDFLVDVPAVPNQEFEQAVQDMVEPDRMRTMLKGTNSSPPSPTGEETGKRNGSSSGEDD